MIYIILKFILVVILTAIPFLWAGFIKPRQNSNEDWRNLYALAESKKGVIKKYATRTKAWCMMFYEKMKSNLSARKLFTLIVAMSMLTYQFVDFKAQDEAVHKMQQAVVQHQPESISIADARTIKKFPYNIFKRSLANWLYPFVTAPLAYMAAIIITFMFFSNKLADKTLTMIHQDDNLNIILGIISFIMLFMDEGRYVLLSEVILILLISGRFYPNLLPEYMHQK